MLSPNSKVKVQGVGRFLSNMVIPNIGIFIAWGLISALFIPTGWMPNAKIAVLVDPIITYLIPLMIGYYGGRLVAGERGAIVALVTTMGLIAGTDIPMLMGAMIVGPLSALVIKKFDAVMENRVKSGFEMLVNNFSTGIIGMLGAIIALYFVGPIITTISAMASAGVETLIASESISLVAIIIEPIKILFLNNAINHGIFTPLGIQQAKETGQSLFFLLESNPGPAFGVLLAYIATTKGRVQQTAAGATVIHLFGGIQEVYFPYILMKPRLLIALILGSMVGIYVLVLFNAGLVAPASPGSIIAILLLTPKTSLVGVIASFIASTAVSFVTAIVLLKGEPKQKSNLQDHASQSKDDVGELVVNKFSTMVMLTPEHVCLNMNVANKEEAISLLGQKLVELGHVEPAYIEDMHKREALLSTYLGESIALPHGMIGGKQHVIRDGVVFGQIPAGVEWGSEPTDMAKIVVAIAAKNERHIQIISSISLALDDDEVLERLKSTTEVNDIVNVLNGKAI
ncbi:PTS sugar transporter subunit IIA [Vibrio renipiscarius]|uniref:Uncharacterized protein n=1 Tax=Vibrio renipiscarius TaxID=1461322 RepID=A0A0C2JKA7_9VIBR|nr:PTS sugar transporter subunit IIA [Vibrio renipiscarius]KII77343.1 hypothetical protein PL18_15630 [Vibrio renipiscarius]KII78394.1 hypothetical protein OJ16_10265 [Vibrio renipiscarius]